MGTISCETFSQTQTPPFPISPPPLPSPTHPHHYPSWILSDRLLLREINGDGRWWWPGHPLSHPCMGWTYRWGSRRGEFLPTLRTRQHWGKLSKQFGQREKDINELESFAHRKLFQYKTRNWNCVMWIEETEMFPQSQLFSFPRNQRIVIFSQQIHVLSSLQHWIRLFYVYL